MTSDEEIQRGYEAQRIMDEPMVKEALQNIENGLLESMRLVPMADIETQHRLVLTLQLLGNFKRFFKQTMDSGKMAKAQITDLQSDPFMKRTARKLRGI